MFLPSTLTLAWALLSAASELDEAAVSAQDWLFGRIWKPRVGQPFQIVLSATVDPGGFFSGRVEPEPVQIFDVDLFDNTAATIRRLKWEGKKVICYFSAGTSETWRPDFKQFKPKDQAAPLPMWPGERWLNVNSTDVLRIMRSRIRLASRKGCDAVDPDNMDGYSNENGGGFNPPLSEKDSIKYVKKLADYAHFYGMSMGLKNAQEIIPHVIRDVEFAVNEQCSELDAEECDSYEEMLSPKRGAGKPVFHIEYVERTPSSVRSGRDGWKATWEISTMLSKNESSADIRKRLCSGSNPELLTKMSTVIKVLSLDGWVMYCNGRTWETKGHPIAINPINQGKGKGKEAGEARIFKRIESDLPIDSEYEYHLQNDFDDYTDEMDAKINAELDKKLEDITFNTKRRGAAKERRPSPGYQSQQKR